MTKDKRPGIPQQIDAASWALINMMRTAHRLAEMAKAEGETYMGGFVGGYIVQLSHEALEVTATLRDLRPYFVAGYLRLCETAQHVAPAKYKDTMAASYHTAAGKWLEGNARDLDSYLRGGLKGPVLFGMPKPFNPEELQKRFDSNRESMRQWAAKVGTEEHGGIFSMLQLEAMQAMLIWEMVPSIELHRDDADEVRAKYQVIFSAPEPTTDVKDLSFLLANRGGKSKKATAREFTKGNEGKAESLLSQIRQLESEGRIEFREIR